jgi:hypothetical protein
MPWRHAGAEGSPEFDAIQSGPRTDENRMAKIDFNQRRHPSLTTATRLGDSGSMLIARCRLAHLTRFGGIEPMASRTAGLRAWTEKTTRSDRHVAAFADIQRAEQNALSLIAKLKD